MRERRNRLIEQTRAFRARHAANDYFKDHDILYPSDAERGFMPIDNEWLVFRPGPEEPVREARIVRD